MLAPQLTTPEGNNVGCVFHPTPVLYRRMVWRTIGWLYNQRNDSRVGEVSKSRHLASQDTSRGQTQRETSGGAYHRAVVAQW